jgi:hypothetical protein
MELDFAAIDADNHCCEANDAFTRHLDPKFARRGVQVMSDGRHTRIVIGGKVNRFIGSDWIAILAKRLKEQANQTPRVFREAPLDQIRRNVWVTPYCEEDLHALADLVGVDRISFGSDWPHDEGLAEPLHFTMELAGFDAAAVREIMRDSALELLGPAR